MKVYILNQFDHDLDLIYTRVYRSFSCAIDSARALRDELLDSDDTLYDTHEGSSGYASFGVREHTGRRVAEFEVEGYEVL